MLNLLLWKDKNVKHTDNDIKKKKSKRQQKKGSISMDMTIHTLFQTYIKAEKNGQMSMHVTRDILMHTA